MFHNQKNKAMTHEKRMTLVELIEANNAIVEIEVELRNELNSYRRRDNAVVAVIERYEDRINRLKIASQRITVQVLEIKAHYEAQQAEIVKLSKAFYSIDYEKLCETYINRLKQTLND